MKSPNRIREIRDAKGLTLEQVAEGAGTSNQQISKLEKGGRRLDLEWMARVSRGLGCDPWELLPPSLSVPPDARELARYYLMLNEDDRKAVRHLAQRLASPE